MIWLLIAALLARPALAIGITVHQHLEARRMRAAWGAALSLAQGDRT